MLAYNIRLLKCLLTYNFSTKSPQCRLRLRQISCGD